MKCIEKIEQIQRNSCRFIFHEYRRDTSLLINRLNLDSLYACRLIQQATMFYKIHYSLVYICPPSYIQHANHISSRTDHPLKYCNKNPLQINVYKYSFSPPQYEYLESSPCSDVSHVIPSVDNFHKFAIPAIRDMQPLFSLTSSAPKMLAMKLFIQQCSNKSLTTKSNLSKINQT